MSDPALAPPPPAKGVKGSLIELAIVVLLGAGVGTVFEWTRPGSRRR